MWGIKGSIYKAENVSFSCEIRYCFRITVVICPVELLWSNAPQIKAVHTHTSLIYYYNAVEQTVCNKQLWLQSFHYVVFTEMAINNVWLNLAALASKKLQCFQTPPCFVGELKSKGTSSISWKIMSPMCYLSVRLNFELHVTDTIV